MDARSSPSKRRRSRLQRRQHGWTCLSLLLGLMMLLTLSALSSLQGAQAHRRSTDLQIQSAQALESAQSGLAWARGLIRDPIGFDDQCQEVHSGAGSPTTWGGGPAARASAVSAWLRALPQASDPTHSGLAQSQELACRWTGEKWLCDCSAQASPASGATSPPGLGEVASFGAERPAPSFRVHLGWQAATKRLHLTVWGCTRWTGVCELQALELSRRSSKLDLHRAALAEVSQSFAPGSSTHWPVPPAHSDEAPKFADNTLAAAPDTHLPPFPPHLSSLATPTQAEPQRDLGWRPIPGSWSSR
jgi:hypothetical protein